MATKADVNKAFRVMFRDLLGLDANAIRPAYQNAPTGDSKTLFGTVTIISATPEGHSQRYLENDPDTVDLIETVIGHVRLTMSVQFYRAGAYDMIMRLSQALQSSMALNKMQAIGVGLVSVGTPRDLTALIDTYYEDRGQVDLTFNVGSIFVGNLSSILSGQFSIALGNYVQPFTMEFEQ